MIITLLCSLAISLFGQATWFEKGSRWGYDFSDGLVYGYKRMTVQDKQQLANDTFLVELKIEGTTNTSVFPQWTSLDTLFLERSKVIVSYADTSYVLYDFDLSVGDYYDLPTINNTCTGELQRFQIDSIGVMMVGDEERRFQRVNTAGGPTEIKDSYILVEELGSERGFFWNRNVFCGPFIVFIAEHLECFQNNDFFYYQPGVDRTNCDRFVDTENLLDQPPKIDILPNPFHQQLQVSVEGESIKSCLLYDLVGNLILQVNSTTLDLEYLPSGVYFLQVETKSGQRFLRQIVKK
ncbi:MAG: T9SS type A sorting domain-containing protein [Bacteroidota bacterium]